MAEPYTQIYFHLVWATSHRQATLIEEIRETVYRSIRTECRRLSTSVLALGGTADHVHLLVRLPTTVAVATLMQRVKGVSSHMITDTTACTEFQWQGGYGAFTVTKSLVPQVKSYIENQERHHAGSSLIPALERLSRLP